jgi:hypothetical protein
MMIMMMIVMMKVIVMTILVTMMMMMTRMMMLMENDYNRWIAALTVGPAYVRPLECHEVFGSAAW